jgi:hypothetical protein
VPPLSLDVTVELRGEVTERAAGLKGKDGEGGLGEFESLEISPV